MKEHLSEIKQVLEEQNTKRKTVFLQKKPPEDFQSSGPNKLAEGKKESIIHKFLMELKDPMIIILIAAAVISGITSAYSGESAARHSHNYGSCNNQCRTRSCSGEQG